MALNDLDLKTIKHIFLFQGPGIDFVAFPLKFLTYPQRPKSAAPLQGRAPSPAWLT